MKFIFLSCLAFLLFNSCDRGINNTIKIAGVAQGTTYHITYLAGPNSNYREAFDSIFKKIDLSLSTYVVSGTEVPRVAPSKKDLKKLFQHTWVDYLISLEEE